MAGHICDTPFCLRLKHLAEKLLFNLCWILKTSPSSAPWSKSSWLQPTAGDPGSSMQPG